ncbi:MAG: methylmalonyl Co-A mutase-associated GTPase MeaB [Cryobacterium sp.]|nr:methylmalonyl Co-A mutase-associated GTPase MeaB [Oligoflexia bacterium]
MRAGKRLALARLISKVENRDPDLHEVMRRIYALSGKAQIWGITGPPGAGKSTMVDQFAIELRKRGKRVAIVAVDPSSPFTGGAILGDRIRMQRHTHDEGVFIRSLGTRGKHGGLSHATKEVVLLLDSAGFDVILVETAGVGQTELDVLKLAQTVVVALVPESGDSIQVMKAGLMEIADIFAVNKSDRPEADKLVKEIITMVGLNDHDEKSWMVPVKKTEATRGVGMVELLDSIGEHQAWLGKTGNRDEKGRRFLKEEVLDILVERLERSLDGAFETRSGKELLEQLLRREIDPYSAADTLSGQ